MADDRSISDERALGRMEGRLDSLEQRVGAVEGVMSRIEGKLDAVQATLAGQRSVGAAFGRLLNVGVSSSGWVAFLVTWWRGLH